MNRQLCLHVDDGQRTIKAALYTSWGLIQKMKIQAVCYALTGLYIWKFVLLHFKLLVVTALQVQLDNSPPYEKRFEMPFNDMLEKMIENDECIGKYCAIGIKF